MPKKGAFVLTPVGSKEGRYNVVRAHHGQTQASCEAPSGKVKLIRESSPVSKQMISGIVQRHANGLKRLADR